MSGDIMDIKETADYLNMKPQTVYRLLHKDKLPALKIGGQWKIKKTHLDKMFDKVLEDKLNEIGQ